MKHLSYVDGSGIWNGIITGVEECLLDARGGSVIIIGKLDDGRLCITLDTPFSHCKNMYTIIHIIQILLWIIRIWIDSSTFIHGHLK